jgi:glyoxylase-like metal-dependent hydrolase (beta-lactamase superfamily II)
MEMFGKRLLVETGYPGANVSCMITARGLVLIDTPMRPADAREWASRVKSETGREIAFLICTDHHYDHVMGFPFLTDRVICHTTAARGFRFLNDKEALKNTIRATFPQEAREIEEELANITFSSPLLSFDRRLVLDMGDATFHLEFVGGHSPGTILIYLPEERTLFTGDNVETQFPYFGQCRFSAWREGLHKMKTLDVERVVPGHGYVGGPELIDDYIAFFKDLEEEVKRFHQQGLTADEMANKSATLHRFPTLEAGGAGQARAWLAGQYKLAVDAILGSK